MTSTTNDEKTEECMDLFTGIPVMVQLKNPLLAAISAEEVKIDEEGESCGSAALAFFPAEAGKQPQPVMLQVIRGEIEQFDDKNILVATMGGDNRTPVRMCVERENVANVTFCVEHVAASAASGQSSPIIKPGQA